ncbi:LysR family transcriptional regulator [Rhizobium sp. ZX09]|nr:LysR family transcriptional regulator [Rhizobium sp. ZX09]
MAINIANDRTASNGIFLPRSLVVLIVMPIKHLPPLTALRAFEASARLGSFTAAAQELNVTQSAVSQSVRQLEKHLGRDLFNRIPAGVELTSAAAQFGTRLSLILDDLLEATNAVAAQETPVTISCARSVLNHWLLPRLALFQRLHPNVPLQVVGTNPGVVDTAADISVVTASIASPPQDSELLWVDHLVLVAAPRLAKLYRECGDTLEGIPRIDTFGTDWSRWFGEGPVPKSPTLLALRLREATAILRAAIEGLGAALLSEHLAIDDVLAGRLVMLSDRRYQCDRGVWLQMRWRSPRTGAGLFSAWLREECASLNAHNRSRGHGC